MNLEFDGEELAFQTEVREWVGSNLPEDIRDGVMNGTGIVKEQTIRWQKILHDKGWIAPSWPKEYGGTEWTAAQKYIFANELAAAGAPALNPFGLTMCGPVIYTFGNEEQKAEHLPGILNSDVWWCQGYSEPGSGSDLASLKMAAISDGDDYIVNGSKIWTSGAHIADWIFCLVRTSTEGKRQEGISFLLIPMDLPGIEVSRITMIDGGHHVNQVFFTDVRVPKANRIGEENKGWTYAKFLLVNERNGIAQIGGKKRQLARLNKLAKATGMEGETLADSRTYQEKMAHAEIALNALEYTELRYLAGQQSAFAPGSEASGLKIKATELQQSMSELFLEMAAYYSLPYNGFRDMDGVNEPPIGMPEFTGGNEDFLYGRAATIYGGSNEIQKDVMAKILLSM
ncbi:MAG: pimeloyl-CoA dehydrogenase large subunit [Alphaproteobacteria bacterium]|nr:MAG: pimeloyl-CoA dehydrogenase large subunit [Alphaproteobacteria bacterium]